MSWLRSRLFSYLCAAGFGGAFVAVLFYVRSYSVAASLAVASVVLIAGVLALVERE